MHALAHITGGGLPENLPRVLPEGVNARIDTSSWTWPEVFRWLQQTGNVADFEMYRTFNCGVGMVIALPAEAVDQAIALLESSGEKPWLVGEVVKGDGEPEVLLEGVQA